MKGIKFLKAGRGDSILISSKGENMVIDGGDDASFLIKELDEIKSKNECVNYLVITHHDADHIEGVLTFLNEVKKGRYGAPKDFIKQVFFNSPKLINGLRLSKKSNYLSYKQAYEIEVLIRELDLTCDRLLIEGANEINVGEFKLKTLSPTQEIIDNYADKTPEKYLSNGGNGDWHNSLKSLKNFIHDKSLDDSIPNKTSVVFEIEKGERKGLLTADVTPKRLEEIIDSLYIKNGGEYIKYDFFKLPHHGSNRNITKKIIEKIKCDSFLISTDGNNNKLPNKKTFLKVINFLNRNETEINFIFNYSTVIDLLGITAEERKSHNIKLIPNNSDNGYTF
ncbi:MBL fold metallo-hydrolase [Aquimarina aquimarini]|uniref:MBL fold metallo-hydrolase n=1 Tax=Aquimarina aquimarini TaxID=1191734 RepID=UPI000D55AA7D|nr:MBL fold metallo-hydrolase [Aquimarina aquimarini]